MMRSIKSRITIYIFLSVVALVLYALPILVGGGIALTKYSAICIGFAVGSVIYAVIAFILKDQGNLFAVGRYKVYTVLAWAFSDERKYYTEGEQYKKEFELSAFIYCITIPAYITLAFFGNGFYSALSLALGWTVFRQVLIIVIVAATPVIGHIKEKKMQRIADEADRKEQERRESMGKWK